MSPHDLIDNENRYHIRIRTSAILMQHNRILLLEYIYGHDTVYQIPGGNLQTHEELRESVRRELLEELDLEVHIGKLLHTVIVHEPDSGILHCVFLGNIIEGRPTVNPHHTSAQGCHWIDVRDIDKLNLYPNIGKSIKAIFASPTSQLDVYGGSIEQHWFPAHAASHVEIFSHGTQRFYTRQDLVTWLDANGVDMSQWGSPGTQTVTELWHEICAGETRLRGKPPRRFVNVVEVIIRKGSCILIETRQVSKDGRVRCRYIPPSEKMWPDEEPFNAALRCLREELDLLPEDVEIVTSSYTKRLEVNDSPSYPGLETCWTFHSVEARIRELPEHAFSTDESSSDGKETILHHDWEWRVPGARHRGTQ